MVVAGWQSQTAMRCLLTHRDALSTLTSTGIVCAQDWFPLLPLPAAVIRLHLIISHLQL